jgi:hypothetical protein
MQLKIPVLLAYWQRLKNRSRYGSRCCRVQDSQHASHECCRPELRGKPLDISGFQDEIEGEDLKAAEV